MQSRIQGYMYNITSETDYSERMLPPTPPREKEASPPTPARHVSSRAIIDEAPPRPPAPQQEPVQDGQAAGGRARRDGRRRLQARQRVSGSGLLHASHFRHLTLLTAEVFPYVHRHASLSGGRCLFAWRFTLH